MTAPTTETIREAARASLDSCVLLSPRLNEEGLPQRFIAAATDIGDFDHYKFFPGSALEVIKQVRAEHGESAIPIFLRTVLLTAIIDLLDSDKLKLLPPKVEGYHRSNLYRMALESGTDEKWLDISHDLFHKEFGLATLRLYSAGAQLVDVRCGIPRSIAVTEGLMGVPMRVMKFARLGGFKPYFQIHTHKFNLDLFNEPGWEECYRCCAELYALHPKSLGMFGSSWFYDPVLETVSPRLSYLRRTPVEGGAQLMFYSVGGEALNNALSTSSSRRELYESGKYMPKSYMLVWGKADQIAWANRNPNN